MIKGNHKLKEPPAREAEPGADGEGCFVDTMSEIEETMHRLMELHLELMVYFKDVAEEANHNRRTPGS